MMATNETNLDLRIVVELRVKTRELEPKTRAAQLVRDLSMQSSSAGYVETPESLFIPIRDLQPRIEDVADFLRFEVLQTDMFELVSGVEIREGRSVLAGVPFSSNLRVVADLFAALLFVRRERQPRSLMIGSDDRLALSIVDNEMIIEAGKPCRIVSRPIRFPDKELFSQVQDGIKEANTFAQQLRSQWDGENFHHVEEKYFDWVFALDLWPQLTV